MTAITQVVEVWDDNGDGIEELSYQAHFGEEHLQMSADKFQSLLAGSKTTKIRREIAETIGGPGYSSVRVTTAIEVICDQSEASVKKASSVLYDECAVLNEAGILKAYEGLLAHRAKLGL